MTDRPKTRFYLPRSLPEALAILADLGDGAAPIAGGTDLALQLRLGRRPFRHLVGVTRAGLDRIVVDGGDLVIGAAATLADVARHDAVRRRAPELAQACTQIGGPQIQAVATLGGNLGNASPAADSLPPLLVEDARVRLASRSAGERELPLAELLLGPGKTARRPDELITAVVVPDAGGGGGPAVSQVFRKYGPRRANVISAVTFAARLAVDEGRIAEARLALGSVAPTAVRARAAEAFLAGRTLGRALGNDPGLAAAVAADVRPIDDVRGSQRYKTQLALNSVRFALWQALAGGVRP